MRRCICSIAAWVISRIGSSLCQTYEIPVSYTHLSVPEISRFRMHVTVKEDGENLWTIAQKEHTTVEELLRLNQMCIRDSYRALEQGVKTFEEDES